MSLMALADAGLLRKEHLTEMQYVWEGRQDLSIIWGKTGFRMKMDL